MILGLDLGSRTGWAIMPSRGLVVAAGWWDIAPIRGESPGCRYLKLRAHLAEVHRAFPSLHVIAYEQAHHRGGPATEYAAGCVATVQAYAAEHNLEHASYHSATLKLAATGSGRASKEQMIEHAKKFVPAELLSVVERCDDTADAIHVARLAAERLCL